MMYNFENSALSIAVIAKNRIKFTFSWFIYSFIGNEKIVRMLLDKGANITATDDTNDSALTHAAEKGKLLRSKGVASTKLVLFLRCFFLKPNVLRNCKSLNPFFIHSTLGHHEIIRILIEKENSKATVGNPMLVIAAKSGKVSNKYFLILVFAFVHIVAKKSIWRLS